MTLKTWKKAQIEAELKDELYNLCKKYATPTITGPALYNLLRRGDVDTVEDLKKTSLGEIAVFRNAGPKKLAIIAKMKEE